MSEPRRQGRLPVSRELATVVLSTVVLILLCLVFAPSSVAYGALSGSLPFAAILAFHSTHESGP